MMNDLPDRRPIRNAAALVTAVLLLAGMASAAALQCPALTKIESPRIEARFERGLLFRVSRAGRGDSYLFGTMHLPDGGDVSVPDAARRALAGSRHFAMEVVLDEMSIVEMAGRMYYRNGGNLHDAVGNELASRAGDLLVNHGVPAVSTGYMKPWAAFVTLSSPPSDGSLPMDYSLMTEAQQLGIEVHGLETPSEQLDIFASMPEGDQAKLLLSTVCHYSLLQQQSQELIRLYRDRDLRGLLTVSTRYESPYKDIEDALFDALIWQRNEKMLARLEPLLESGPSFVAVGALHLPGRRGLLEMLERRGYAIEVVY
ncbi:MAG: TraB/GumN family protein [Gammaproteobacteria bacterium]|nr:TraB/GumN family protein [Gammaproteobacteria bacterium]